MQQRVTSLDGQCVCTTVNRTKSCKPNINCRISDRDAVRLGHAFLQPFEAVHHDTSFRVRSFWSSMNCRLLTILASTASGSSFSSPAASGPSSHSNDDVQEVPTVDAVEARRLIDREGYLVLDVRSTKAYDNSHITKPTQITINLPFELGNFKASSSNQKQFPPKGSKLLVMCEDGGEASHLAILNLLNAGYNNLVQVQGGYQGWTNVWSPSGKRRPPPGRWVSTGTEALKSGLNIPGVAESYDEGGNLTKARYVAVNEEE
ncbi:hypothetical protein CEUSTIGMA_g10704.t1 [Chlamydomonas eustigma]|uniref:Rhodanese domain-containing protein n=1 Tax=Chlamydomonas eustigma TaxID=1157962 RepID=A0A250XJN2_9CHLO|nr:hypothetical protein CEUSTIGMA_g10704.t1 [Chlamydomonas eustigma]|eukprot:GAX83278.1 hypothetical protein CEUSTIGMA_g10704.t1 [Chlamydomonas eustigma]